MRTIRYAARELQLTLVEIRGVIEIVLVVALTILGALYVLGSVDAAERHLSAVQHSTTSPTCDH
jgi:hypothetical protein